MKNKELQAVAIKWIAAKLTNLDSEPSVRSDAWMAFEQAITKFMKKHDVSHNVMVELLRETAASIYADELKHEIFGYEKVGV